MTNNIHERITAQPIYSLSTKGIRRHFKNLPIGDLNVLTARTVNGAWKAKITSHTMEDFFNKIPRKTIGYRETKVVGDQLHIIRTIGTDCLYIVAKIVSRKLMARAKHP